MLDKKQIEFFVDAVLGSREIGVDGDGQVIETPRAPEARAFVIARIGAMTPLHGYDAVRTKVRGDAFAALLCEVAAGLTHDSVDGAHDSAAPKKPAVDLLGAVRDFLEATADTMPTSATDDAWHALARVCSAAEQAIKR